MSVEFVTLGIIGLITLSAGFSGLVFYYLGYKSGWAERINYEKEKGMY